MYRLFLLLLLITSCVSRKAGTFDPFQYDTAAYEKVKLNYLIKGKGDTTLFFIHGWNLDHTYWNNQVAEFSPRYRLVLFDLAGCGSSGKNRKNWTVESFARDIIAIIKQEGLKNVVLVAHSMGGEIALEVADKRPNSIIGIVGIDNLKNVGKTITEQDKEGMQPYIKKFLNNYSTIAENMARSLILSKDTPVINKIVNSYKRASPDIAVASLMNVYPKSAEAKNKLFNLAFSMKFIMCTNTPYDEQALRQYCKQGYRIITINDSGHFPMVEQPVEFNKALHQLLEKD